MTRHCLSPDGLLGTRSCRARTGNLAVGVARHIDSAADGMLVCTLMGRSAFNQRFVQLWVAAPVSAGTAQ